MAVKLTTILMTISAGALTSVAQGAPGLQAGSSLAKTPGAAPTTGGYHHYHSYGHYRHYGAGYYSGHYRHYYGHWSHYYTRLGSTENTDIPAGSDTSNSFVRDGHRYYWHTRNGHRFYSSHPEPGDTVASAPGLDLGEGEDLEAPLGRRERAERAARVQKAQARLAAVEKRVQQARHQHRLKELSQHPTHQHK